MTLIDFIPVALKMVATVFKEILSLFKAIYFKFVAIKFRIFYRKPPIKPDKIIETAYSLLGGIIYDAVSFKNADSKKIFIAALHENRDSNNLPRLALLEQVGNSFTYKWASSMIEHPRTIALVDLDKDGIHEISFSDFSFGASGQNGMKMLYIYRMKDNLLYELSEGYDSESSSGQKSPKINTKEYADKKYYTLYEKYAVSQGYLQRLEIDFKNSKFAEANWRFMNGYSHEGGIALYSYPGHPEGKEDSISARLDTEEIEWIGYFKGPLFAYNKKLNEHFIVLYPEDPYKWVKNIIKYENAIVFSSHTTKGFYTFSIKEKNLGYMRKFESYDSKEIPDVESIKIVSETLIINDKQKIPLNYIFSNY